MTGKRAAARQERTFARLQKADLRRRALKGSLAAASRRPLPAAAEVCSVRLQCDLTPVPSHPVTPDGRYFVERGRLWRCSDPHLSASERQALVNALMGARRAVRAALSTGDGGELAAARAQVDAAKRSLGERGPVWWADRAPDLNRRMVSTTAYAEWFDELGAAS